MFYLETLWYRNTDVLSSYLNFAFVSPAGVEYDALSPTEITPNFSDVNPGLIAVEKLSRRGLTRRKPKKFPN